MELKIWQSIFQEACIQMDIETLQNLSEDILIYRVMEFLNKSNLQDSNETKPSDISQAESSSRPDSENNAMKTGNVNADSPSASSCNEISVKDLRLTDNSDFKKTYRPIKILFRLLANIRNLMAKNKLIYQELQNEQKNVEDENDKSNSNKEVAAAVNGIKDSINLIQKLQQKIPSNCSNTSAPVDPNELYTKKREQSMVALENLRIEIESKSDVQKNCDNQSTDEQFQLPNTARRNELKTTAVVVKENFDLLNRCSEYLLNEISEGIMFRQAMGKNIFED